ncbi:MAG TPA: NrfD/PsrC family molybdoenzyme membrane anchor subunit [Polyangia bacterium]|nr:NrfD/PsrC family molybdoenzyme membrane anchor subunit [Polyangia bacterium]
MTAPSPLREPVFDRAMTPKAITDDICRPLEGRGGTGPGWWVGFSLAAAALGIGLAAIGYEIATGIGTWGLDKTVGWAFDIVNFVFWVGIGHAGTLISALLLLTRQRWRTSVSRSAEAMTVFAIMCAAIYPLIHMGRPWMAFWVLPLPNARGPLWVNFRSPLLWDVFAINTYLTVSALFWYVGLIPDLATLRDRARGRLARAIYGALALGWSGSCRAWSTYEAACRLLAGMAVPLVVLTSTVVSTDFAASVIPGWHATIFPPYFVAGAIHSGFATVLAIMVVARGALGARHLITRRHLDNLAKVVIVTSSIMGLIYASEHYTAFTGGNPLDAFAFRNRALGPYAWTYYTMLLGNVVLPQILWWPAARRNVVVLFVVGVAVDLAMWMERFVIIVVSLHRDFLPSSWTIYKPTIIEVATFVGTFGLFFCCFFLFIRFLPAISIAEVKAVAGYARPLPRELVSLRKEAAE